MRRANKTRETKAGIAKVVIRLAHFRAYSNLQSPKDKTDQLSSKRIRGIRQTMRAFWEIENYPNAKKNDEEEEYCKKHFKAMCEQQPDGRFVVQYPVKEHLIRELGNSREIAMKRFQSLERKFDRKPEFKKEYAKFMQEYLQLGHMKPVTEYDKNKFRIFLSHHAVTKESHAMTKIRVVFDASSKYSKGRFTERCLV